MKSPDEDNQGPVIRDRRRIDPVTGQVRDTGQAGQAPPAQRGAGQSRPGKHAVSRPGAAPGAPAAGGNPGAGPGGARPGPPAGPGSGAGAAAPAAPAAPGQPAAAGPDSPADRSGASGPGAVAEVSARLAERTADLQRVQAEYANYRKRVERDRTAVREQALSSVLIGLLPVLDDIGRAREHDELTGGFKSVAESLEAVVIKLGLTAYGEDGDPFDPNLHEALMHSYSIDVSEPTCVRILQPGYKVGDRILRPARVAVAEPGDSADQTDEEDPSYSGRPAARAGDDSPRQADADRPGDHAPTGAD
jgi:molecular chaperone GrpE